MVETSQNCQKTKLSDTTFMTADQSLFTPLIKFSKEHNMRGNTLAPLPHTVGHKRMKAICLHICDEFSNKCDSVA